MRSGLGDEVKGSSKEIRVSPYRLATHLGMAFATFSGLVWTGGLTTHNPYTMCFFFEGRQQHMHFVPEECGLSSCI